MKQKTVFLTILATSVSLTSCAKQESLNVAHRATEKKPAQAVPNITYKPTSKKITYRLADVKTIKTASLEAQMVYDTTLSGLRADAIIIGKPTQRFVDRETRTTYFDQDGDNGDTNRYINSEWVRGPFLVEQVLQQKSGIGLTVGQSISLAEPVGLDFDPSTGVAVRTTKEQCFELQQNSRYVVFVNRATNGTYGTHNYNLGRFNTDGTDALDESGIVGGLYLDEAKTDKQKLRQQLTAAYGVTFAVPTTVAPSITTLSPNKYAPSGSTAFTLVVNGNDFKNGAVVQFDNKPRATYFDSATQLRASVSDSDVGSPGIVPVTVTNPDGQASASASFEVLAPIPAVRVTFGAWQRANGKVTVTQVVKNISRVPVIDFRYTSAWITTIGVSDRYNTITNPLPALGDLTPGETRTVTLDFADTITPGGNRLLSLNYSHTGLSVGGTTRVTIP